MELELGMKITKAVDEFTSANLLISKDRGGTLFLSRETDTMFILTAHLNGYTRENIKIDINEDGTKITIRGEKPVQEMVMVGWKVVKKEVEMRGFQKKIKIPNGVVLDKIEAKFNDEGSILTISIPKIEKGVVSGNGLEELEDDKVLERDSQSSKVSDEANERETSMQENQESEAKEVKENGDEINEIEEEIQEKRVCDPKEEKGNTEVQKESDFEFGSTESEPQVIEQKESEKASLVEENRPIDETPRVENSNREKQNEIEEENKCDRNEDDKVETSHISQYIDQGQKNEDGCVDKNEFGGDNIHEDNSFSSVEENSPRGKSKLCMPIVVGSALFVSFIVFVFHFIRSKNQTSRRRN